MPLPSVRKKALREAEGTREVPIIIISAMTDDESKQRALAAGASAFYTKPFSPTALLKQLESVPARDSHRGGWMSCIERFARYVASEA